MDDLKFPIFDADVPDPQPPSMTFFVRWLDQLYKSRLDKSRYQEDRMNSLVIVPFSIDTKADRKDFA